jgi:hypothetical protein
LERRVHDAIESHLAAINGDVDTLTNENVVLESEAHPRLRGELERVLGRVRGEMEEVVRVVSRV